MPVSRRPRVVVAGSGWHFLSGISYYTCRLSNAMDERYDVGAILMRRLLPARLYPGRDRVGQRLSDLAYAPGVEVFDGVDWWAAPSLPRAVAFLREQRPDVLVLQWWTGAVLHSYLALAAAARRMGIRVVIEFHEVQDTAELRHSWAARYVRAAIRPLLARTSGVIVHSAYDQDQLNRVYDLGGLPSEIALHGPFDHHGGTGQRVPGPDGIVRLLYFGTIRPYKGLEDLVAAFGDLGANHRLTVVGETWEGWTLPLEAIAASPARDRITVVNRYVPDAEVDEYFAAADAVVLPYRRSSASGPLHIAMSHGLPVVVTSVGGLVEAAGPYPGTVFVPPGDPAALATGIREAAGLIGRRHTDPSSWDRTVDAYERLFTRIGIGRDVVTSSPS
ncbi:glycosyl transferase [Actinoplanes sp. SE50]|uniref:glycosyltransferase n=1 Tax=unclassified Actinoplanes TaxID=2626549 RepID=UPI00023ECF69|nr:MULTISPECIES: glycosyltransferase [unclassified Actinoplanes]AEV87785.1 glycosyl transferase group 1 [Actinoplanes sp. SE50/110]ATO86187.1 glycosyl transferase [Actinoplanes sp. SE50]SLM03601.1 glycosyl transferase [Actinoplanes sp. SE50/110]